MRCESSSPPPATPIPTTGIPTGPQLVGLLDTTFVVAQQLIKSTTCLWIGMGRVLAEWILIGSGFTAGWTGLILTPCDDLRQTTN